MLLPIFLFAWALNQLESSYHVWPETVLNMKSDRQRWSTSPPEKNEVIKHGHGKLPLQPARGGRFWPSPTTLPSTSLSPHLPGESGDCLVHRLQKAAANSSISKKGAFPRPDTSRKISIEPENDAFGNTLFLFQGYILRFHINLSGCTI